MEHTDETTEVHDTLAAEDAPAQEQAQQPEPEQEPQPAQPDIDIDALVREAEQRGYLRGRNEQIALAMQQPTHWESPDTPAAAAAEPVPTILANMRRSVWD